MVRIDSSLVFLTTLRAKARLRQIRKHLKTVRGAFLYVFGFLAMWVGFVPLLFSIHRNDGFGGFLGILSKIDPAIPRVGISAVLLVYCVLTLFFSSNGSPMPFELAEIDFLFCGPFSRRELLLHKLAVFSLRMLPAAAIFAVFSMMMPWNPVAGAFGVCLAFLMALLFTTAIGLAGQAFSARLYTRTRRLVAVACVVVLGIGVWQGVKAAIAKLPVDQVLSDLALQKGLLPSLQEWVAAAAASPLVRIVLAPFEPFSRLLTAPHLFPDILIWGSLALGINALLVVVILKLDADYYETSLAVSHKVHDNLQRLRKGGFTALITAQGVRGKPKWTLPDLPFLGGAGVVAWRQLVTALRGMSKVLLYGLPVGAGLLVLILVSMGPSDAILWGATGVLGFVSVIYFPPIFRFDFRGDLDKMESLKVLPAPSWAVAAGQVFAPALIVSVIQAVPIAVAAIGVGRFGVIPCLIVFAPLLNGLLFAVENIMFLLFPTRLVVAGPGDFQVMARMYLTFLAKAAVLLATFGIGLGPAGVTYWLSGSWALTALVAVALLIAEAAVALWCTAWAFQRFDPSTDTPV